MRLVTEFGGEAGQQHDGEALLAKRGHRHSATSNRDDDGPATVLLAGQRESCAGREKKGLRGGPRDTRYRFRRS
jgi:hypothetical protein